MNSKGVILSTAYLPPIQYFAKLISHQNIVLEVYESYTKQSYRNRCTILSCNGPLSLTVPVIKTNGNNTLTKDIKIDNATNWQKNHWKAIESAYRNSAYFEFVADIIIPFYSRKEQYLIDFNFKITNELLSFMGVVKIISNSTEFIKNFRQDTDDFRSCIHPKVQFQVPDNDFSPIKYFQVFNDRFDFCPNLSIIDLLFNEGLDSLNILEESIIKKPASN